jgi:hypothetical protein
MDYLSRERRRSGNSLTMWLSMLTLVVIAGMMFYLVLLQQTLREAEMKRAIAPIVVEFAHENFAKLDQNGDGIIRSEELKAADNLAWSDRKTATASLTYLRLYMKEVGHFLGKGADHNPVFGISPSDLESLTHRLDSPQQ